MTLFYFLRCCDSLSYFLFIIFFLNLYGQVGVMWAAVPTVATVAKLPNIPALSLEACQGLLHILCDFTITSPNEYLSFSELNKQAVLGDISVPRTLFKDGRVAKYKQLCYPKRSHWFHDWINKINIQSLVCLGVKNKKAVYLDISPLITFPPKLYSAALISNVTLLQK